MLQRAWLIGLLLPSIAQAAASKPTIDLNQECGSIIFRSKEAYIQKCESEARSALGAGESEREAVAMCRETDDFESENLDDCRKALRKKVGKRDLEDFDIVFPSAALPSSGEKLQRAAKAISDLGAGNSDVYDKLLSIAERSGDMNDRHAAARVFANLDESQKDAVAALPSERVMNAVRQQADAETAWNLMPLAVKKANEDKSGKSLDGLIRTLEEKNDDRFYDRTRSIDVSRLAPEQFERLKAVILGKREKSADAALAIFLNRDKLSQEQLDFIVDKILGKPEYARWQDSVLSTLNRQGYKAPNEEMQAKIVRALEVYKPAASEVPKFEGATSGGLRSFKSSPGPIYFPPPVWGVGTYGAAISDPQYSSARDILSRSELGSSTTEQLVNDYIKEVNKREGGSNGNASRIAEILNSSKSVTEGHLRNMLDAAIAGSDLDRGRQFISSMGPILRGRQISVEFALSILDRFKAAMEKNQAYNAHQNPWIALLPSIKFPDKPEVRQRLLKLAQSAKSDPRSGKNVGLAFNFSAMTAYLMSVDHVSQDAQDALTVLTARVDISDPNLRGAGIDLAAMTICQRLLAEKKIAGKADNVSENLMKDYGSATLQSGSIKRLFESPNYHSARPAIY